jgi:signal transduction histidine kinase/CheY-like chemotaxis protein
MTVSLEFLAGGGRVGALMRAHDWSRSPLGHPATWPQSLRSVVDLLLQSRFPMFVAWGPELGFLYNDPYADILGAKHPAALGSRFYDIWSEIWPDISPLIDAAMGGVATYREDLPLLMNRKGYDEQTWFTFSYSPVRDESGRVAGMFCAVSETTNKILAERALRESEGRLRALITATSYALYRMSPDWSQLYALEGGGFIPDADAPSESWLRIYVPVDDQPRVLEAIQRAIASRSIFELEHRVRRVDGSLGWTLSRAVPLLSASGEILEWFGAASDITVRKQAEAELRELNDTLERRVADALAERKLLADIVEATNAFVQVVDHDLRWLAINRAAVDEFERVYGVRPQIGDSLLSMRGAEPERQAAIEAAWRRALSGEEFTDNGELNDFADDERIYEKRFSALRDREGRIVGAYQFAYDITERRRDQKRLRKAEAALRQSQKLESIGQLTGGVAHDFNNLLAVFATGLQLLERNVGQEQRQRIFAGMRRALTRGTGLTRHLLAFSRKRPVNPEAIDPVTHLRNMREMLNASLGGNLKVAMLFDQDVWPIEVDAGEMELAILNLALNARDAMPDGGMITISVSNTVDASGDGPPRECVKLTVSDTGTGMSEEVMARAFEPFFTTKDVNKGSGLGLPQVYGFAHQSGGSVSLQSRVGEGTTVTVLVPRASRLPSRANDDGHVAADTPDDHSERGHVLLVEDDREVSALAREMLMSLGFSVTHVASPDAALGALANARDIDVVLSDIMMPGGVSGLELAREIRRRHPGLPIVLTTGYVESAAGMTDGEFELLTKPYTIEAVAEALGRTTL